MGFKSDIEIAQEAKPLDIREVGKKLGLTEDDLELYGKYKAKVDYNLLKKDTGKPKAKLILTTAINPTPAGEGKTTTTIGVADALSKLGKNVLVALREPSLGPVFGIKGGAAGGGYAQVVPMEDINLHFTGDFHAIGAANNLLAAMLDNHIHQGNELGIDIRSITWRRCVDMNDRQLRNVVDGLGARADGVAREDGFDITVASEVMAAGNLSVIAKMIMPAPCYYFFIICGACFALGTTLNSSIASAVKPLFAAAADGWFPPVFARLNKHKVPYAWLMMFAIVNVAAIVSGMNISMMGKLVLFIGNINSVFLIVGIMKLPKLFPEPWAKSPFHVSNTMLYVLLSLSLAVTLMQAYMNCQNQPTWVIVSNVVMFIFAFVYSKVMLKSGKVKVSANYELL